MILTSEWTSYLWIGTAVLLDILILAIALRYMRHRDRGHLLIVLGGLIAGLLGIASEVFDTLAVLDVFELYDSPGAESRFMMAWTIVSITNSFGQLLFLTGIFLAASRMSNERRRIAELEAIIRDRDRDSPP